MTDNPRIPSPSPTPYYDPQIREAIEAGALGAPVSARSLNKVRASRLSLTDQVPLSDEVTRTDRLVPGPDGAPDVRLRVHRAVDGNSSETDTGSAGADLQPCLFWMHGGGYVLGSPEQDDLRFDRWCQRFNLVGVGAQYRLAPEHPYPAAIEDCYAGLKWVMDHGTELGIDVSRVGIGGPSAGGGLAAALALLVRDRGEFSIDYQLLIYPMIDDTRSSYTANLDVPVWNPESNHFGWSSYLGDLFEADTGAGADGVIPPYAAPARATDLTGLPSTYIMVGTLDGFADEDIDYAQRLNHAGVAVELHVYPGAPHGFEGFAPMAEVSRQARRDINNWLAAQLGQ